jgi:hypothetical protein
VLISTTALAIPELRVILKMSKNNLNKVIVLNRYQLEVSRTMPPRNEQNNKRMDVYGQITSCIDRLTI